jgi:hypothetical protein
MKTLVLVFIGMMTFLADNCQGYQVQGQPSVLYNAKSTVIVHSVWHNIYIATQTGGQILAVVYYSVHLQVSEGSVPCSTNITTVFSQISKTVMHKPINEEGSAIVQFLKFIMLFNR